MVGVGLLHPCQPHINCLNKIALRYSCYTIVLENNKKLSFNTEYSEWTSWDQCPVSCGGGVSYRERNVTIHSGNSSYYSYEVQSHACNTQPCPPGKVDHSRWITWQTVFCLLFYVPTCVFLNGFVLEMFSWYCGLVVINMFLFRKISDTNLCIYNLFLENSLMSLWF